VDKNRIIMRALLIIIVAVLVATGLIFYIMYSILARHLVADLTNRTYSMQKYLREMLVFDDFYVVSSNDAESVTQLRGKLSSIKEAIGFPAGVQQLYIAYIDSDGNLLTSLSPDERLPAGYLLDRLQQSFNDSALVVTEFIYTTGGKAIFGSYWTILNQRGEPVGVICIEFDITTIYLGFLDSLLYVGIASLLIIGISSALGYLSMSKARDNIYKFMAYCDILTGYDNRMAFESKLARCNELATEGSSITVMVFDVNNLKIVNDTLGHKDGDELIKNTADIIAEHIGDNKALYRIGGDEFGALLVDYTWEKVSGILKAIRSESRNVLNDMPFSCAVGMSRYDRSGDSSIRDALLRADSSMYEDKKKSKGVTPFK